MKFCKLLMFLMIVLMAGCGTQDGASTGTPDTGVTPVNQTINQLGQGVRVGPDFTVTSTGNVVFSLTHDGVSNFIVHLKDDQGTIVDFLANEIGSFTGSVDVLLDPGTYHLSVNADGHWTAAINGFVVADTILGDPASIALTVVESSGTYLVQATVVDGNGTRVIDGTVVNFSASPSTVSISQSGTTTSGIASVPFVPASVGDTTLTATTTNGVTESILFEQAGPPASITLATSVDAGEILPQNGVAALTVTVLDSTGQPVIDGTSVSFIATEGSVNPSTALTINGAATATYLAGTASGVVEITATVETGSGPISEVQNIEVETGIAASVLVESVQPSTIGIKGSGKEDTALITYRILDSFGNPALDGIEVNFEIVTTTGGGEGLTATSAKTAGGKVSVSLRSGTAAGTVAVKASTVDESDPANPIAISTVALVSMVSNRPDSDRITIGAEKLNLAGGVTLGLQSMIHAYLGDHAGNVPPDGTPVSFYTECGTIGQSTGFVTSTTFGVASATLQTSAPTVPGLGGLPYTVNGVDYPGGNVGLCRIMAMTPGTGGFQDLNGNGVFDVGSDICDTELSEPYVDANDSSAYEDGEFYVDVNENGQFDSDVVDCVTDSAIWTSANLLISDYVGPINILPTTFSIPVGESQLFTFSVADIYKNALVAGTRVTVTLNPEAIIAGASLVGMTDYVLPDTVDLGREFSVALVSDTGSAIPTQATVTVKVTPPADDNNNGAAIESFIIGLVNAEVISNDNDVLTSGDPASISSEVARPQISVTGVGQIDRTTVTIQVTDDSGKPIDETLYNDPTLNNIEVRLITSPHGGEYVAGEAVDALGETVVVDSRAAGAILMRTIDGKATLNLHSGTLPGNIEVQVRVLYDVDGVLLTTPLIANVPQVTIASGPPHTIVLTSPHLQSVENLLGGVYKRNGTVLVTDRYGNTVPDGTTVYLGLGDTVLTEGTVSAVSGSSVTAADGTFDATVTRNEATRSIQPNDRLILRNVPSQDKNRHVTSAGNGTMSVQTPFSTEYTDKPFSVVASLLGGSIGGENITGQAVTLNGMADIYVTYPANPGVIGVGCGSIPARDLRHEPRGSAKVFVVAESTGSEGDGSLDPSLQFNDRATAVDEGQFCFAPMAGFTLTAVPGSDLTDTGRRSLKLVDGGDEILLPYWPIETYIAYNILNSTSVCRVSAITVKDSREADPSADPPVEAATGCLDASAPSTQIWLEDAGICYDSKFNVSNCVDADHDWFDVTSDLTVTVYVNPFTGPGDLDIDKDGLPDVLSASDVNKNGIPDDLNNDGEIDLYDGDVVGWYYSDLWKRYLPDYQPLDPNNEIAFYTYPYTFEAGNASALIVIEGEILQTGDRASVTFVSGDAETVVPILIP